MRPKPAQGYTEKPYLHICKNCYHRKEEPIVSPNSKCGIGGFVVKLTASCRQFMRKS